MSEINSSEAANIEAQSSVESVVEPIVATVEPELFEVKVNGQTIKVPLDELRNGYQRDSDYRKKTMELSDYRRTTDGRISEYEKERSEVQKFFQDPRVQSALKALQDPVDPNKSLTHAEVMQLFQSQAGAQEEKLAAMAQELEVRSMASRFNEEIDSTIKQLVDKHPVLADIDGINFLLRNDVSAKAPANLEEAKKLFAEAAQSRSDRIEARFQTKQKETLVQQQKLAKGGIEPPGGSRPMLPGGPTSHKLGSKELFNAALEEYAAASAKA